MTDLPRILLTYKTIFQTITIRPYLSTTKIPSNIDDALSFINCYITIENPNMESIISLLEDIHKIHMMKISNFYPSSYQYITNILDFFIKNDIFGFKDTIKIVDIENKVIDFTKITVDKCDGCSFMRYGSDKYYWSTIHRDISDEREANEILPQKRRKFQIEPISDEEFYRGKQLFDNLFMDYFVS